MGAGASITDKEAIELMKDEYESLSKENLPDDVIREKLAKVYKEKYQKVDSNLKAQKLIMISLHVKSMHKSALLLKQYLESQGYRVWLCTEMVGGVDFRTSIVEAVRSCTVFLPLINDAWAQSGECSDEFSLAKRLHLTSHESGRTKRNEPRLPIFIPFAFSDLNWNDYPHIQLLAASTNFLVHDSPTLEAGNTTKRFGDLLLSMHAAGLPVDLPEELTASSANDIITGGTTAQNGPHEQLLSITESLRAFATSIQAFAAAASEKEREREKEKERTLLAKKLASEDSQSSRLVLSKEYLGVSNGSLVSNHERSQGYTMQWWNSLQLEIKKIDESVYPPLVEGIITETNLRKQSTSPSGEEVLNGSELPPSHPLYKWGKDLFVRTSKFKGEFKKDDLLLSGTADRVSEEANGVDNPNFHPVTYTYHLVVRPNELVGVQQGRVSVSSMILKQVI